jgi:hypothetical protein
VRLAIASVIVSTCSHVFSSIPTNLFSLMAKAQDARKEKKKEPAKTTKEKKAEKDEKKVARARKQD